MPKIWLPKFAPLLELLQEKMHSGINVIIYTAEENTQAVRLSNIGIQVICTPSANVHTAIIDSKTVWYGAVNYLAHVPCEEYTVRIQNPELCAEILGHICDNKN